MVLHTPLQSCAAFCLSVISPLESGPNKGRGFHLTAELSVGGGKPKVILLICGRTTASLSRVPTLGSLLSTTLQDAQDLLG